MFDINLFPDPFQKKPKGFLGRGDLRSKLPKSLQPLTPKIDIINDKKKSNIKYPGIYVHKIYIYKQGI
jgi:hypothetical protein